MATVATAQSGLSLSALVKPFVAFGEFLIRVGEANTRVKAMRELMELSDEKLEEIGIKREEIVHRVFADKFYV